MNATEQAAIIRGLYNAIGTFGITLLSSYMVFGEWESSAVVAGIAAFGALGFRAGAEGMYDSLRQKGGHTTPADVSPNPRV